MPAIRKADADLDFGGVGKIIRALMNPVASDPGSPVTGEVWFNTTDSRFKVRTAAGTVLMATMDDVTSGSITGGLWDAQSVVIAIVDNTPVAQIMASNTVLGRRASGDLGAVSYGNLLNDLMALGAFNTAVDVRAQLLIDALIAGAPGALNTLDELAQALNDDAAFSATVTTALGLRTKKFAFNYGNGVATTFTVNHALATTDVVVQARVNATGEVPDHVIDVVDANNVSVSFNTVYATDAIRVVVIG